MYMGRNYTLYVNVEQFADEANKSGLINRLLSEHYNVSKTASKPSANKPTVDELKKATGSFSVCKNGHLYRGAKCTYKGCYG